MEVMLIRMTGKRKTRVDPPVVPLSPFLTMCFISEIATQCQFADLAIADVRSALEMWNQAQKDFVTPEVARAIAEGRPFTGYTETTFEQRQARRADAEARSQSAYLRIWYSLQGLLDSTAIISKLLWGDAKDPAMSQRKPLRDALGVSDDSALKDRLLRNHSEHIDQKMLKQFGQPGATLHFIIRTIGEGITIHGAPQAPRFHRYDPDTGRLSLWGFEVLVPTLEQAVHQILGMAKSASEAASNELRKTP